MPIFRGCRKCGCGARRQPHSARSCVLRAGGARCRSGTLVPGGGGGAPPASVRGVRLRAFSLPQPSVLGAGGQGPLPICRGRGGCGRANPSPTQQRTLLRAGFARFLGGMRAPGAGATCLRGVCLGLGTLPQTTARPWDRRSGPAARFLWAQGRGRGDPSPTPQRTLLRAGFARCGGGTTAPGGGGLVPP